MEKPDVPKCIEAQEFVVRDEHGVIRMYLSATSGEPVLHLCDRKGVPCVCLEMQNDRPCLGMQQQDGNPLFSFKQLTDGSTILGLSRNNKMPALLVITEDGKDVKVGLCRSDGEPVWVGTRAVQTHDSDSPDL